MKKTIRALIVDDSVVFRSFMRRCLNDIDGVDVVGTASDGKMALRQVAQLKPDVLTLDMEMPKMHGIEVLKSLQQQAPDIKVIVVSNESETNAEKTIEALESGACDFIIKSNASDKNAQDALTKNLSRRLFSAQSVSRVVHGKQMVRQTQAASFKKPASFRPDVIAIGSSTGGPAALSAVFSALPASVSAPITITQHMPKLFVQSLATRLDKESKLTVQVAEDGMRLMSDNVYIAPGEIHMEVVRKGVGLAVKLVDGPKLHHCKPAVDRTFYSLAKLSPVVKTLAIVLTGMGSDGADGAKEIAQAKGYVIAQDEMSSAVWGMPGSTVKAGAANDVLPLDQIAGAITQIAGGK
jgi:two-component system chemotaxis response regulator CheB